jgi:hypothetical protein
MNYQKNQKLFNQRRAFMKISEKWTTEERMKLVGALSKKLSAMNESATTIQKQLDDLFGNMGDLGIILTLLNDSSAETLEINRKQIMKFVDVDPF